MNDYDKDNCVSPVNQCSREKTAQEWLKEIIDAKRNELADLEMLAESLPVKMSHRAERAMREMLIRQYVSP